MQPEKAVIVRQDIIVRPPRQKQHVRLVLTTQHPEQQAKMLVLHVMTVCIVPKVLPNKRLVRRGIIVHLLQQKRHVRPENTIRMNKQPVKQIVLLVQADIIV